MPVRSLSSPVLRWPDATEVERTLHTWTDAVVRERSDIVRIGYFGSYARGDWGVGSDVDLIVVIERSDEPFERRPASWDVRSLAVAADLLVYTQEEWMAIDRQSRFGRMLGCEAKWLYSRSS